MSWFRRLSRFSKRKDLERAARLRQRGDELASEGSLSEAAEAYEESIKLDKFNRATYIKLAETYFSAYDPQEAEATLQKLADMNPDDTETYRNVVRFCFSSGRKWGTLSQILEMGLALDTQDTNYYLAKSYCAHLKYIRADTGEERSAALEEMIEAAEKSIELDPTNADAYYLLAQGLSWKYFNAFDNNDPTPDQYGEVIRALEKSLEVYPDSAYAESFLSHIYFSAGRYEDVISSCERRLKLTLDNDPSFLLAETYAHLGRFQEAIATMRRALEWQEGDRLQLGWHRSSIRTLKLVAESDTDLSRVRSACLFASYANALFSRTAYHWDSIQQGNEAVESCLWWYEKALTYTADEPDPLEWQVHYRAGLEYLRQDRYEEARNALLKSVELHPDIYEVHEVSNRKYRDSPLELLSECYVRMGLLEQGRDALQRHVEMIRRTGEHMREKILALEAQAPGSYAPWRLSSLSAFHRWCEEYETEATQNLAELSRESGGGSD